MARSLNKVMLIGNLGKDAETRHTPSGAAVTNFSLATTYRTKDQAGEWRDKTDWHDVVVWRAENVAPYLKKGKRVFVEGRLQTRSWEDQSGQRRYRTEVVSDSSFGLMLLDGRDGGSGGYSQRGYGDPGPTEPPPSQEQPAPAPASSASSAPDDDDIPF